MRVVGVEPQGQVHRLQIKSALLAQNLLGDPAARIVDVYVPFVGADGLPLLVDLVGWTAGGPVHTNWKCFTENVPERLDRLIASGRMRPVVVAFPDCCTRLGGNQYINSSATGPWADFLTDELVPFVESRFACGGDGRRGVFGKSSGGYGAIMHAMMRPDFWAAVACHSGDMGFDLCYRPALVGALRAFQAVGGVEPWVREALAKTKLADADIQTLEALGWCASYDPDPSAPFGLRLPLDSETAEFIAERWANFERWDPVNFVEQQGPALSQLKGVHLDCGSEDQFMLQYGARRFTRALRRMGVSHVYEEFQDDHVNIDYRMDVSLPFLAAVLSK